MNLEEEDFPLSLSVIYRHQTNCRDTRSLANKAGFKKVIIDTLALIHTDYDKIVIPEKHQETVLTWYHYFLNHIGESRMELTICKKLYWRGMTGDVRRFVKTCTTCKKLKKNAKNTVNYR